LTTIDNSEFLESEKELLILKLLERLIETEDPWIIKTKPELKHLLQSLESTREHNAKIPPKESQHYSIIKKEDTRKKALKLKFDLEKNMEKLFFIEGERSLKDSTKEYKESERENYRAKRTPDAEGKIQRAVYGDNPPVQSEPELFKGSVLGRRPLQQIEDYFESITGNESTNITINADGSYQVKTYTENSKYPTRSQYNQQEMNDILIGLKFKEYLCEVLNDNEEQAVYLYYGKEYFGDNSYIIDFVNPKDETLSCMLKTLESLNIKPSQVDKNEGTWRVYISNADLSNANVKKNPKEELRSFYEGLKNIAGEGGHPIPSKRAPR
jgi:hypothetical protein